MAQTVDPTNPLELAKQIGYELYGEIGEMAFEELELCYASKLAPKFSKQPKMRSWTNLNFYWARGYFKNSTMDEFQECLPVALRKRNATSGTIETMFGSMPTSNDKIIPPLFHGYEICFMPELLAFLGTKEGLKEKVNVFNEVLEGNLTSRDLLKFGNATTEVIEKYKNGFEGLYFDGRTLKYYPNTCFVVGTRPLDNETYTYLETSGFWSRFHTIQFRITDRISKDIFTGSFYSETNTDINALKKQLKAFNEKLIAQRSKISDALPNYENLMLPVLQEALKIGEKVIEKNPAIDNVSLFNARIKGDILREVKAYQILYPQASDLTVQNWIFTRLPHFFDFTSNPIIASDRTASAPNIEERCLQDILIFTKDVPKKRDEIQDNLQKQSYKRITIDRALEKIKNKNLNKSKEHGTYET